MTALVGVYLVGCAFSFAVHGLLGLGPMTRAHGPLAAVTGLLCVSLAWPKSLHRLVLVIIDARFPPP